MNFMVKIGILEVDGVLTLYEHFGHLPTNVVKADGKINEFEVGTTEGLKQIHHFLFQDVFDFAGKIRDVDLAKGNFRFAPVMYLNDTLRTIDNLPDNNYDEKGDLSEMTY